MKKLNLSALFPVILIGGFVQCASMGGVDKVSICKKGCKSNYDSCKDKAVDDTKKVLECKGGKAACVKGCEESG